MQYSIVVIVNIVNIVKQVEALAKGFFRVKVQYGFKVLRKRGRARKGGGERERGGREREGGR